MRRDGLLLGHDALVASWVWRQLGDGPAHPNATAIGVVKGGRLVGGVAFHDWNGPDVRLTIAGTGSWITRPLLRAVFAYCFVQLGVRRCTVLVKRTNKASRSIARRLGFVEEGTLREAFADGGKGILMGLVRADCRWIEG